MAVLKLRPSVATLSSFLPFSVAVANKQPGPFQPCNLVAKLGEVAAFGTDLKFVVKCPRDSNTAANRTPVCLSAYYR